jgi:hypothetical protein
MTLAQVLYQDIRCFFILPSYFPRIKEFHFILVLVENWVTHADI